MEFQPEVKRGDSLYKAIYNAIRKYHPKTILEIGSANGKGSTQAIIDGIIDEDLTEKIKVICIEAMEDRYADLVKATKLYPFIKTINASTVPVVAYVDEKYVTTFMNDKRLNFPIHRLYDKEMVLSWRRDEIDKINSSGVNQYGIYQANKINNHENFGMVIIDGSAFSAHEEYKQTFGAGLIFLDDVCDIKSSHIYYKLCTIHNDYYELMDSDFNYRNGFASFRLKDKEKFTSLMEDVCESVLQ